MDLSSSRKTSSLARQVSAQKGSQKVLLHDSGGKLTNKRTWLKPSLYGGPISYEQATKFPETIMYDQMTLIEEILRIKAKAASRINISNKKWNLKLKTLRAVFFCLVRALLDYDFFLYDALSQANKASLASIQLQAVKTITKNYWGSRKENERACKVPPIETRMAQLRNRYTARNIYNPMVCMLIREYRRGFESRPETRKTPLSYLKETWH